CATAPGTAPHRRGTANLQGGRMSARKTRPQLNDPITPGMSRRDMAAALGVSTAQISRWVRLAAVPEAEFEAALARGVRTVDEIIRGAPVPTRGRAERMKGLFKAMNTLEQANFLLWAADHLKEVSASH